MLSKEQFEKFEKDIKGMMEDYGVRVKVLNDLSGIHEDYQCSSCKLYINMSSTLRASLIEYAYENFNDIQTVMSRTIKPNMHNQHFSYVQGYVDEFGCINFYDGIFHYEFKNNELDIVYLDFMSIGFGKYYSRNFQFQVQDSDELKFNIEIVQKSNTVNYSKENDRRSRRTLN